MKMVLLMKACGILLMSWHSFMFISMIQGGSLVNMHFMHGIVHLCLVIVDEEQA